MLKLPVNYRRAKRRRALDPDPHCQRTANRLIIIRKSITQDDDEDREFMTQQLRSGET